MATNKGRLTKKNKHFKKKSVKISGAGAGSYAMGRKPISRTRSASIIGRLGRSQHGHIMHTRSAPAILPTQPKAFETKDELYKAVHEYFNNATTRKAMVDKYGHITNWNTTQIIDMSELFEKVEQLSSDAIRLNWDTRNVTNMRNMFFSCKQDFILNFDTSNVTDMFNMFCLATNFNQPLPESFDTSNVTTMAGMFYGATQFNQPLPKSFKTHNVTNMDGMFEYAENFNQEINFDTSNVTTMYNMFTDATNFNKPINFKSTKIQNIDGIYYIFANTKKLESPIYIKLDPNFRDFAQLQNLNDLFDGSKIMDGLNSIPELIKITKNTIEYPSKAHSLAYVMTKADEKQSEKHGKHRQYPAHLIDYNDELNDYLGH